MTLNQELILTRCREIEESLDRLEEIRNNPRETFLVDRDLQDIASYRLLVAIDEEGGYVHRFTWKPSTLSAGKLAERNDPDSPCSRVDERFRIDVVRQITSRGECAATGYGNHMQLG